MSVVVIAEKPSVARDLARVLGAQRKGQGYLEGNGYRVTWALGHLVHLAEPDDYGPPWKGRWSAAQLPMIPDPWRLKLAPKTADQFQVVRRLITDPATERLVCATDAGREGELIFRLIYEQARCTKPFDRLWVSSLTDDAIRAGFRALKPGAAYDDLGRAARARAQADWLIGMNLTRAYTVRNGVLCTIGRVQTPTLAMIVARDAEIAGFKATPFYELVAHLQEGFRALYCRDGETRILDKLEAERLHTLLAPHRTGTVRDLDRHVRREPPPPLYDLTSLQRDANRRLGLTAAQVLELAQTLYETHKLISYPRTESRHIGEDLVPELPRILKGLDHPQAPAALERLASGHRLGRAYVDQTKLTDHHAILPTGRSAPASLSGVLRRLYDLIQTRFVCCFLPDQVVEETRVMLDIGGHDFLARGSRELDPGWRVADPPPRRESGSSREGRTEVGTEGEGPPAGDDQALPPLEPDQRVHVDRLDLREGETSPPRPYTDATLLAAMKNAGRTLDDQDLARAMRSTGLGTPATRAEIIEKLIRTGYVERQRKQLRSTDKGRALIAVVAPPLKEPALTAHWEQRLKEVEEGARPVEEFDRGIRDLVLGLIPQVWSGPAFTPAQAAAARRTSQAPAGRARPGQKGGRRRGPADHQGERRAAPEGALAETGADTGPVGLPCPKCRKGRIIRGRRGFGCDRYREGCDFVVWSELAGKRLTERQIADLIRLGRTRPIRGFQDAAGGTFGARLELGPGFETLMRRSNPEVGL
ncbi:MAG: DNA topoisomerase 3 [Bdellovibrio bacteriovorus]